MAETRPGGQENCHEIVHGSGENKIHNSAKAAAVVVVVLRTRCESCSSDQSKWRGQGGDRGAGGVKKEQVPMLREDRLASS